MKKIRLLVPYGPQKTIEKAVKEGRWIGGDGFSSTPLRVAKSGRVSVCWGSGKEDDEYSEAHSGVILIGAVHKDKIVQLRVFRAPNDQLFAARSEEHTSELQSLMRISYAVFCLKKKNRYKNNNN